MTGAAALREVLVAVYAALGLTWDPGTAGAAEDVVPGLDAADLVQALRARLSG